MQNLAEIRVKLDKIDRTIIDHLRNRADLVHQVAKIKGKRKLYIKPRREVTMMEPLLNQAEDKLLRGYIWKTWRELISHFTLTEGPLSIAVEKSMWDLARDHYGYRTPLEEKDSAAASINDLQQDKHTIAILPSPEHDLDNPWWLNLIDNPKHRIFTLIPRLPGSSAKGPKQGGVSVAELTSNPTGNDISYLAAKIDKNVDIDHIKSSFPLSENITKLTTLTDNKHGHVALIKMNKHISEKETQEIKLPKSINSLHLLGGYCVPPDLGKTF